MKGVGDALKSGWVGGDRGCVHENGVHELDQLPSAQFNAHMVEEKLFFVTGTGEQGSAPNVFYRWSGVGTLGSGRGKSPVAQTDVRVSVCWG